MNPKLEIMKMKTKKHHIELVNIRTIKSGDVILLDGKETTVTSKYIKENDFMGRTLFGDSYNLGILPVMKVVYTK